MRFSPLGIPTSVFLLLALAGCSQDGEGDDYGSNDAADQGQDDSGGTGADSSEGGGSGDAGDDGTEGGGSEGGDAGEEDDDTGDDDVGDTGDDGDTDDGDEGDDDSSGDEGDDTGEDGEEGDDDSAGDSEEGDDDSAGDSEEGDDDAGDDSGSDGDSGEDSGGDDSGEDSGGDDSGGGDGSDGCGMDHDTGDLSRTVNIAGTDRQYLLIVPASYDPDRAYPLIFGMHGLTGNGPLLRQYMSIESLTAGNAIHVYPSAIGGSWDLSQTGVDMQFFDAIVDYATSNLCIDSERIFSYGHSYGGYYSNALGCYRGDVLRAIGPVAGGGPNGFGCQGEVAAILMHGTDDGTVGISQGQGSRDHWKTANGCSDTTMDIEPSPCIEYTGCDSAHPVVWCQHTGIGHNVPWSGQLSYGPQALWDFFQRF